MTAYLDFVFSFRDASHDLVFVEVEDESGKSVSVGEWVERGDDFRVLRIRTADLQRQGEPK